ncbi:hypothetical protein TNCV_3502601 [Trichonephila clavipes]|uniref:Uncharacterized protein n=1 Tax=Trichonephila clavipes TaxID=2585209 RepID=A0A8X6VCF8_TRICX|nr:hypothetical protein TNCV_3502601 [Trichonephila clavipes]
MESNASEVLKLWSYGLLGEGGAREATEPGGQANFWQVISVERLEKLVESMPRGVAAVIKTRGGPTRYYS